MCILIAPVTAHAPSDITIAYDPAMHKLTVTIIHSSEDPETHYIRGVQVKINGEVISDPTYKNQSGRNVLTYTYDVMANPGDSVWVVATCIRGQSLEEHYDIPKQVLPTLSQQTLPPASLAPPPETTIVPTAKTTHTPMGILPLAGAAAVLLMMRD